MADLPRQSHMPSPGGRIETGKRIDALADGNAGDAAYDVVVVGSGFGGSVAALRLAERGRRVLVLERGRRFADGDFARSTWDLRRYLWAPALRCFGILEITPFRHAFVLHGAGVGGGSLGYANVLMAPDDATFDAPEWRRLGDWRARLVPHYERARRMLGVAVNPRLGPADEVLREIARGLGTAHTFRPTTVGAWFGETASAIHATTARAAGGGVDPYFGGEGPARASCTHCGACMVGCRVGAKNTLPKNYLWLAERRGARIEAEREVRDIRPLADGQPDGARFEIEHRSSTGVLHRDARRVRARQVIVAAGAVGTLRLLLRCRDVTRSLPALSPRLGSDVRTNGEALLGVLSREPKPDYSKGVAITSIVGVAPDTTVEPVRYPAGSSAMRFLSAPLVEGRGVAVRLARTIGSVLRHPLDFLRTHVRSGWAERSTVLLVMQTTDSRLRIRIGRSALTLWRRGLVSRPDDERPLTSPTDIAHRVTREFAARVDGIAMASANESLLGVPMTAHLLGGCPMGATRDEGVVDDRCRVHGYEGLMVMDGSVMPGNPGVNPSLTITAMAEWACAEMVPGAWSLVPEQGTRHQAPATSSCTARSAPRPAAFP